jgi:hypothetical protein
MERQTQSSISNANQCERCVLKSHVIYEKRVVFCPCSGYLPCAPPRPKKKCLDNKYVAPETLNWCSTKSCPISKHATKPDCQTSIQRIVSSVHERTRILRVLLRSLAFRILIVAAMLCGIAATLAGAQTQAAITPPQPLPAIPSDLSAILSEIEQASQATAADLRGMRIDRWKADSSVKQQSQSNADSVQRNISSALPGMLQAVRATPGSLAAQFKLYRNLNALYDVFSGVTESAGAFGTNSEYQTLARDLSAFDKARRDMANRVDLVTAQQDSEITRLRSAQAAAAAAAAAANATPPKKIVVDDTPTKSAKKKKATPPKPSQ